MVEVKSAYVETSLLDKESLEQKHVQLIVVERAIQNLVNLSFLN